MQFLPIVVQKSIALHCVHSKPDFLHLLSNAKNLRSILLLYGYFLIHYFHFILSSSFRPIIFLRKSILLFVIFHTIMKNIMDVTIKLAYRMLLNSFNLGWLNDLISQTLVQHKKKKWLSGIYELSLIHI